MWYNSQSRASQPWRLNQRQGSFISNKRSRRKRYTVSHEYHHDNMFLNADFDAVSLIWMWWLGSVSWVSIYYSLFPQHIACIIRQTTELCRKNWRRSKDLAYSLYLNALPCFFPTPKITEHCRLHRTQSNSILLPFKYYTHSKFYSKSCIPADIVS